MCGGARSYILSGHSHQCLSFFPSTKQITPLKCAFIVSAGLKGMPHLGLPSCLSFAFIMVYLFSSVFRFTCLYLGRMLPAAISKNPNHLFLQQTLVEYLHVPSAMLEIHKNPVSVPMLLFPYTYQKFIFVKLQQWSCNP